MRSTHNLVLILILLWIIPPLSQARPERLEQWKSRYPGSTLPERLERATGSACTLCHGTYGFAWNDPGNAYREFLHIMAHSGKPFQEALEIADVTDTDGDGVPSGTEILMPRPDGVGYHPGLVGDQGVDPTGITGAEAVSGSLETPPMTRDLAVDPPMLDFGYIPLGKTATRPLTVRNNGTSPVYVARIGLLATLPLGFSLPSLPPLPAFLDPGESFTFPVQYQAGMPGYFYQSLAWLELGTGGAGAARATVLLRGRGGAGKALLSSPALNSGPVEVGLDARLELDLDNVGDSALRLYNPRLEGPGAAFFRLEWDAAPKKTLGADFSTTFAFVFKPEREGPAEAVFKLAGDDPESPELAVSLAGEGRWRVTPGDSNRDGALDLSDAVKILINLFVNGEGKCPEAQDADDSGAVEVTDAIFLLSYLFLQGPAPEICPFDATPRYLGCQEPALCIQ
ncbi:MAG: choice-of-anchor D domain-containing protein [Planctomycetes bacterium]|nr:choice-of-anchor D domain-containing protein [Planctomycetota bacterium]